MKTKTVNPYAKRREVDNPYAEYTSGGWTWRILKLNQSPQKAATNEYATAFCAVKSSYTYGSWELGDTYLDDIGIFLVSGPDILGECMRSSGVAHSPSTLKKTK